jgi:hypothetical protein
MEQTNFLDEFEEKKLPSTLNVLTILTFIGCGVGLLSGIWQFVNAEKGVADLEKTLSDPNMAKMPEFMKGMINQDTLELAKLQAANKIPMIIIGILSMGLCLFGALQMRKKQMQGYYLWLIGELLPFVGIVIFINLSVFKGFGLIGVVFPLIFVILYTAQRKHLK